MNVVQKDVLDTGRQLRRSRDFLFLLLRPRVVISRSLASIDVVIAVVARYTAVNSIISIITIIIIIVVVVVIIIIIFFFFFFFFFCNARNNERSDSPFLDRSCHSFLQRINGVIDVGFTESIIV